MTPKAYCRDITRRSGSSFLPAFRWLPEPKRSAMFALYAFCRKVDDIVDHPRTPHIAQIKLHWWREEVERLFQGEARHPIAEELQRLNHFFTFKPEPFLTLLDGMAQDLHKNRFDTFNDLENYCHQVASSVGETALIIFLSSQKEISFPNRTYARHLGLAFQLTNILRDVNNDADRGRIYLPLDLLKRHGVTEHAILKNQHSSNLIAALNELSSIARHHFHAAQMLEKGAPHHALRPARLMRHLYYALFKKLVENQFIGEPRLRLSKREKIKVLSSALWQERGYFFSFLSQKSQGS
ncbi:phytoene/squalene synthase family protein [Magnetococcales bacterium HHB-1]